MSETRTLEELLYRGVVAVEVDFDTHGGLEARTDYSWVMGYADLGGEITVTLDDAIECTEDGMSYVRPEAWAELLRKMRSMLARSMILGRMEVARGFFTDEEDHNNIEESMTLLGEEFFNIRLDTAIAALEERYKQPRS
jgi:hypothetical protein